MVQSQITDIDFMNYNFMIITSFHWKICNFTDFPLSIKVYDLIYNIVNVLYFTNMILISINTSEVKLTILRFRCVCVWERIYIYIYKKRKETTNLRGTKRGICEKLQVLTGKV